MSEYFEINPGQEDEQDWSAVSDFITHLAETNENLDSSSETNFANKPQKPEQTQEQKSEAYSYVMKDFGNTENNFQYIRKEIGELLTELDQIRAARAGLQERLHNLNI